MPDGDRRSPLRRVLDVRREEIPFALLMFVYFFLVITTFWILKPLKKPVFVNYYDRVGFDLFGAHLSGAQTELLAKMLNMVVAAVAMVVFSAAARSLRRQQLTFVFAAFFAIVFATLGPFLGDPSAWVVWSFYLGGDLWTTVMVVTFFAFLNDSVDSGTARRTYGPIVLGGVAGGVFGATNVRAWIEIMGRGDWMIVCIGLTGLIAITAWAASRRVPAAHARERVRAVDPAAVEEGRKPSGPSLEGARLVKRSRYLIAIVTIVALYEIVSTLLDYQFTATVQHYLDDTAVHYATVYAVTNWTSMIVQLFLTSLIMSHYRLTVALLVTPAAILTGSAVFLAFPLLWPGSMLSTSDNALNYSLNQSAREALYTPTTRDVKYKAKAFIDMFAMRFAKTLGVLVTLGITISFAGFDTVRWLSLAVIAAVIAWAVAARFAGVRFHELIGADGAPSGPGDDPEVRDRTAAGDGSAGASPRGRDLER